MTKTQNLWKLTSAALLLSFLLSFKMVAFAAEEGVAKVVVIRGEVKGKMPDGSIVDLAKDMWLKEGTVIQSASGSFCRLLFIDKSTMNLGPESQMVIDQFPENAAGIITLMKGQVRSNVTKDYMNNQETDKSKLFIKTKTAAMGVRGTDFQVNYNPANDNTALITFKGAVAIAQFEAVNGTGRFNQDFLERTVSSQVAVVVRQGEFSGVTPQTSRATIPTKLNPIQLETLKKNDSGIQAKAPPAPAARKEFRNPIPPGVDSKKFANNPTESMTKTITLNISPEASKALNEKVNSERAAVNVVTSTTAPPPEGFKDASTGAYAPPAGSVIDLATVNIIPPPKGSVFDPISQTYTIPPELGRVNPYTGSYEAPTGMTLTNEGTLVTTENSDGVNRTPASEGGTLATTTSGETNITLSESSTTMTDESANTDEIDRLAEETIVENTVAIEDELEQTIIENNRTNVTFDLTLTP